MERQNFPSHESPVKRKPLGDITANANSPISPTANLKLLTSVATTQYEYLNRDLSKIKSEVITPPRPTYSPPYTLNPNPVKKGERKLKSLGYLCDRFLKLYPLDVPKGMKREILLSNLSEHLGVEKRRVYDIINVAESLQMTSKTGKNTYTWMGRKNLAETLSHLKMYAEHTELRKYVHKEQIIRKLYVQLHKDEVDTTETQDSSLNSSLAKVFRNERRISALCQKFVMIFLVSLRQGVVSLDLAADILVGGQNKMRLRRLYDIANILVSLRVIEKVDYNGIWKKAAFRYIGPSIISGRLGKVSIDSPLIRRLITEDLNDINSNTEATNELVSNQDDLAAYASIAADHSYSRHPNQASDPENSVAIEPAVKKKLVFSSECRTAVFESSVSTDQSEPSGSAELNDNVNLEQSENTRGSFQVMSKEPIQHGEIYQVFKTEESVIELVRFEL